MTVFHSVAFKKEFRLRQKEKTLSFKELIHRVFITTPIDPFMV